MPGKFKIAYLVSERKGHAPFYHRIGVAFDREDGGLDVKLDAIPVGGRFVIKDYVPRDGGASPASPPETKPADEDDIPF